MKKMSLVFLSVILIILPVLSSCSENSNPITVNPLGRLTDSQYKNLDTELLAAFDKNVIALNKDLKTNVIKFVNKVETDSENILYIFSYNSFEIWAAVSDSKITEYIVSVTKKSETDTEYQKIDKVFSCVALLSDQVSNVSSALNIFKSLADFEPDTEGVIKGGLTSNKNHYLIYATKDTLKITIQLNYVK